jgi:hypothetical protein
MFHVALRARKAKTASLPLVSARHQPGVQELNHFANSRHSLTILSANFSICALVSFGLPPRSPLRRAAETFASDLDWPPR